MAQYLHEAHRSLEGLAHLELLAQRIASRNVDGEARPRVVALTTSSLRTNRPANDVQRHKRHIAHC